MWVVEETVFKSGQQAAVTQTCDFQPGTRYRASMPEGSNPPRLAWRNGSIPARKRPGLVLMANQEQVSGFHRREKAFEMAADRAIARPTMSSGPAGAVVDATRIAVGRILSSCCTGVRRSFPRLPRARSARLP